MKSIRFCFIAVLIIVGMTIFAEAQSSPSVNSFQCSDADTFAAGLNDAGLVVGWYGAFETGQSFVRKKNGPCEAVPNVPSSTAIIALGINDPGVIVGIYFPGKEGYGSGFLYEKGVHLTFDYPDQGTTRDKQVCQTFAMGINNSGQIVGFYDFWRYDQGEWVCNGPDKAFLRESDGTFLSIQPGFADSVQTNAINPRGMTVGNYIKVETCDPGPCKEYGYVRYPDGLTWRILPAGAWDTMPSGINSQGQVVGRYFDIPWLAPVGPCHSFFRDTDGTIVEIKYPGAEFTCVGGINAPGEVSGAWTNDWENGPWHAFVLDLKVMLPTTP